MRKLIVVKHDAFHAPVITSINLREKVLVDHVQVVVYRTVAELRVYLTLAHAGSRYFKLRILNTKVRYTVPNFSI
jgi:hypothetical protein